MANGTWAMKCFQSAAAFHLFREPTLRAAPAYDAFHLMARLDSPIRLG